MAEPVAVLGYGEHKGHNIHPHDHSWQVGERTVKGCSGRFLCLTCRGKDGLPPGTWFAAPECPQTGKTAAAKGGS